VGVISLISADGFDQPGILDHRVRDDFAEICRSQNNDLGSFEGIAFLTSGPSWLSRLRPQLVDDAWRTPRTEKPIQP